MTDTAIKANEREALRLFERGVAAARGGQRRVAAGLLARAVQLNPRHEDAWLWLSGTLDEPREIAFCLHSVLNINPHNQRARAGLEWLERKQLLTAEPAPPERVAAVAPPAQPPAGMAPDERLWWRRSTDRLRTLTQASPAAVIEHELHAHRQGESWWVNFRRTRRDMSRARIFLITVPILLLMLTLALNMALRSAVARNDNLARAAATLAAVRPTEVVQAERRAPEVVISELPPSDDARALAYLSAMEGPRAQLRAAVEDYRSTTSRPGGSSTTHAAAARRLRDTVERAYAVIEGMDPPPSLQEAHLYYLSGLESELDALDDMLNFYGSFSIELANRATVRMSEADRYLERASASFGQRTGRIVSLPVEAHAIR
jgi:hypothetical protein